MFHDAVLEASDNEVEGSKMKSYYKIETPNGMSSW